MLQAVGPECCPRTSSATQEGALPPESKLQQQGGGGRGGGLVLFLSFLSEARGMGITLLSPMGHQHEAQACREEKERSLDSREPDAPTELHEHRFTEQLLRSGTVESLRTQR